MALLARRSLGASGFSIVELLVSCAIIMVLAALGMPAYLSAVEAAKIGRAIGDVRGIDRDIQIHRTLTGCLPGSLADIQQDFRRDPWGRPYVYNVLSTNSGGGSGGGGNGGGNGNGNGNGGGSGGSSPACMACNGICITPGQARKDRALVPINSDFDLFSTGRDGQSMGPLTAPSSQDDIVRASDGAFVGLGRDY